MFSFCLGCHWIDNVCRYETRQQHYSSISHFLCYACNYFLVISYISSSSQRLLLCGFSSRLCCSVFISHYLNDWRRSWWRFRGTYFLTSVALMKIVVQHLLSFLDQCCFRCVLRKISQETFCYVILFSYLFS